jgi:hypothetical protein
MAKPAAESPAPCLPPRYECCNGPIVDGSFVHTRACRVTDVVTTVLLVAMVVAPFLTTALAFLLLD